MPGLNWAVTGGELPFGVEDEREGGANPEERVALALSAAPAAAAFFKASGVLLLLLASISLLMARPILS